MIARKTKLAPFSTTRRRKCKSCGEWFKVANWRVQKAGGGQYCSAACKYEGIVARTKDKPSSDRFGRTWRKADRDWSRAVRERDGYKCQFPGCGVVDSWNHAHHIASRKQRPDLKYSLANGVTLCAHHHMHAHQNPKEASKLGLLKGVRYELARKRSH